MHQEHSYFLFSTFLPIDSILVDTTEDVNTQEVNWSSAASSLSQVQLFTKRAFKSLRS